jgi:hypothetical protein
MATFNLNGLDPISLFGSVTSLFGSNSANKQKKKLAEQAQAEMDKEQFIYNEDIKPFVEAGKGDLRKDQAFKDILAGFQNTMLGVGDQEAVTEDTPAFTYEGKEYNVGDFVPRKVADAIAKKSPGSLQFGQRGIGGDGYTVMGITKPNSTKKTEVSPAVKATELPDFLKTPETSGSEWDELERSMSTLSDLGLERASRQEADNTARLNAARGVNVSAEDAKKQPGFGRWYSEASSEEKANKALNVETLKKGRRDESLGKFMGLRSLISGNQINAPALAGTNIDLAGQRAGVLSGKSEQAGAQSQESLSDALSFLGDIAGEQKWKKLLAGLNSKRS